MEAAACDVWDASYCLRASWLSSMDASQVAGYIKRVKCLTFLLTGGKGQRIFLARIQLGPN